VRRSLAVRPLRRAAAAPPPRSQAPGPFCLHTMELDSLLSTAVLTCRTTDPLSTVAQSMWEGDLGCLPVLDHEERVVGLLTDRDMLMATHLRGSPLWSLNAGVVVSSVVHALPASAGPATTVTLEPAPRQKSPTMADSAKASTAKPKSAAQGALTGKTESRPTAKPEDRSGK